MSIMNFSRDIWRMMKSMIIMDLYKKILLRYFLSIIYKIRYTLSSATGSIRVVNGGLYGNKEVGNMDWDDVDDILYDRTKEEISKLRCPDCGGMIK